MRTLLTSPRAEPDCRLQHGNIPTGEVKQDDTRLGAKVEGLAEKLPERRTSLHTGSGTALPDPKSESTSPTEVEPSLGHGETEVRVRVMAGVQEGPQVGEAVPAEGPQGTQDEIHDARQVTQEEEEGHRENCDCRLG